MIFYILQSKKFNFMFTLKTKLLKYIFKKTLNSNKLHKTSNNSIKLDSNILFTKLC